MECQDHCLLVVHICLAVYIASKPRPSFLLRTFFGMHMRTHWRCSIAPYSSLGLAFLIVHPLLRPSADVQHSALQLDWAVPVGDAASTAHEQERGIFAAGGACRATRLLLNQALCSQRAALLKTALHVLQSVASAANNH